MLCIKKKQIPRCDCHLKFLNEHNLGIEQHLKILRIIEDLLSKMYAQGLNESCFK